VVPRLSRLKERAQASVIEIRQTNAAASQPSVEAVKQLHVLSDGRPGVPEADQLLGKDLDVLSDGIGAPISSRRWIFDDAMASHVFPLSGQNTVTGEDDPDYADRATIPLWDSG
jgi:hypothetical protein